MLMAALSAAAAAQLRRGGCRMAAGQSCGLAVHNVL